MHLNKIDKNIKIMSCKVRLEIIIPPAILKKIHKKAQMTHESQERACILLSVPFKRVVLLSSTKSGK